MRPGDEIEVQSRFEGSWVRGFEVADIETDEPAPLVVIRRRSDGEVLPVRFPLSAVREQNLFPANRQSHSPRGSSAGTGDGPTPESFRLERPP